MRPTLWFLTWFQTCSLGFNSCEQDGRVSTLSLLSNDLISAFTLPDRCARPVQPAQWFLDSTPCSTCPPELVSRFLLVFRAAWSGARSPWLAEGRSGGRLSVKRQQSPGRNTQPGESTFSPGRSCHPDRFYGAGEEPGEGLSISP